jgi:cell division control protein 12
MSLTWFLLFLEYLTRAKKYDNPKHREKEDALRKVFTEQVRQEENRFRQWEQQVRV